MLHLWWSQYAVCACVMRHTMLDATHVVSQRRCAVCAFPTKHTIPASAKAKACPTF